MEILNSDNSLMDRFGVKVYSSTAGSYGSWTQIIASCPFNASGFIMYFDSFSGFDDFYIDVGINEGGIIYPILDGLRVCSGTAGYTSKIGERVYVPLTLPKGKEIRIRCKTVNSGGRFIWVVMYPIAGSFNSIATYGACKRYDVQVTMDNFNGWVEVTPSTPFNVKHIIVAMSTWFDPSLADEFVWWKLGHGAVGSEKDLFPIGGSGVDIGVESIVDYPAPRLYSFPIQIPKGERLVLSQDTENANTNRYDYSIYLFG